MRYALFVLTALVLLPAAARAQVPASDGVRAFNTSFSHLDSSTEILNGWQSELSVNKPLNSNSSSFLSAVGFDASISQHYGTGRVPSDIPGVDPTESRVRRTTILAGARFFPFELLPVFFRVVGGVSRRSESFTSFTGPHVERASYSPAVGVGVGLVIPVSRRIVLRPIQFDYLRFPSHGDASSGRRLATGLSIVW